MLSKKKTMQLAESYAAQDFLCSESMLLALSKCQQVESELIPRIATGFGAGLARCGEICGALAGAIMGLGIRFGRTRVEETPADQRPYDFAQRMVNLFKARFGHTRCLEILGLDLSKESDLKRYREENMWEKVCYKLIITTAGLAYDLLQL